MDETTGRDDDETLPIPSGGGGGSSRGGLADGLERPGDEIGPYGASA